MKRKAFTLLEMLIVLAVMAMLAGAASLSLRGPYQKARLENTLEHAAFADRQIRDYARDHDRSAQIVIHLDAGTIAGVQMGSREAVFPPLQAAAGVIMDQVVVGDRRIDCGEVAIAVSRRGQTPTYAIRFHKSKEGRCWLAFLGATGQSLRIDDERQIDALLRLSDAQRNNAD